jgi:hypothetical protein
MIMDKQYLRFKVVKEEKEGRMNAPSTYPDYLVMTKNSKGRLGSIWWSGKSNKYYFTVAATFISLDCDMMLDLIDVMENLTEERKMPHDMQQKQ